MRVDNHRVRKGEKRRERERVSERERERGEREGGRGALIGKRRMDLWQIGL